MPTEQEYKQALKDVSTLIPLISHRIMEQDKLPHTEGTIIKLNKEVEAKVKLGDNEILDEMWELSWSIVLKNAINVITAYHKDANN